MAEVSLAKLPSDKYHGTLLMINQNGSKYWYVAVRQQAITWTNVEPDLCRHKASLGHNELMQDHPISSVDAWQTHYSWIFLD